MTKKEIPNSLMNILLEIKEDTGASKQAISDIKDNQIAGHERIYTMIDKVTDRVSTLEKGQSSIKTKVAIFATAFGAIATLFINIVKQKFGL